MSSTSSTTSNSGSTPSVVDAVKTIRPLEDVKNLPTYPCARESLMYGMAGGAAVGAIRTLNTTIRSASHWGIGTFMFISAASWTICRAARERERRTMKTIVEKFPERNIKVAQQRAERRRQEEAQGVVSISETSPNSPAASTSASEGQKSPYSWFSWFRGSNEGNSSK